MKLIVASNNKNKIKEIKKILNIEELEILSLNDINYNKEIIEDGFSFLENARIKAKTISNEYQDYYVIADDSGLEIESLNNEPGIYSARYSGKGDYYNNLLVLEKLTNINNRKARFVTSISLYKNNEELNNYIGIWEGNIAFDILGENGFGYDPIFIPTGYDKSVALMSDEFKNENSHRAKALNKFSKDFKDNILN